MDPVSFDQEELWLPAGYYSSLCRHSGLATAEQYEKTMYDKFLLRFSPLVSCEDETQNLQLFLTVLTSCEDFPIGDSGRRIVFWADIRTASSKCPNVAKSNQRLVTSTFPTLG